MLPSKSSRLTSRRALPVAAFLAVALFALSACGPSAPREPEAPAVDSDGFYRVEVLMKNMSFDPESIAVPDGAHLILDVENVDGMPHDLVLDNGFTSNLLARGEKQTIDVGVVDGQVDGWCDVSGHREAGMILTITG